MLRDYAIGEKPAPRPAAPPVADARPNGYGGFSYTLPKLVPDEGKRASANPDYDLVGGYSSGGVTVLGRPRWQVEEDRRKAELAREREELEMEYRRWMINQMMGNADGMNVRKLLTGGKYVH